MRHKHRISLKRQRRRVIVLVLFILLPLMATAILLIHNRWGGAEEPEQAPAAEEAIPPVQIPTPVPTATPQVITTWLRYPCPLDDELQRYITDECRERDINPALIMAMIGIESGYDPEVMGDGNASVGLMQIQPVWHLENIVRLEVTDLQDPYQNVLLGIDIVDKLYETGNSTDWVLMAYNGGISYANNMTDEGFISDYVFKVETLAEEMMRNATVQIEEVSG